MANLEFHISTNVQQAIADLEAFLQQIQKLQATLSRPLQIKITGLENIERTMRDVSRSLERGIRSRATRSTETLPSVADMEKSIRDLNQQLLKSMQQPFVPPRFFDISETMRSWRNQVDALKQSFGSITKEFARPTLREMFPRAISPAKEQRIRYYEMREQILGTFMQLYALRNFGRFFEGVGTALDRFRQDLVNTGLAVGENMVRVAAVTGMTVNQMDRFASTVGKISAQAFLQPQQAMEVAYLVATRGIQDRSALETAIRSIGQFAFMTRADPAQAARSLLTAFFTVNLGKPMDQIVAMMQSEFPRVTNLLYSAYTRSPLEAQTILDALKYIGPAYGVTGRPFSELISTMMAAAQVIPQGGLLGRHLRSFLVFLSNPERIARAMQIVGKPTDVVGTISQLGLPQFLRQLSSLLRNLSPEQQLQFWHTAVGLRAAPLAIVMTKMVDQIATYAETLANETANSLQKAIENIRSTPFGRLQTLGIEIQETKRQLSEAAMEAEIMMKQMQLRLLKMFASLPEGLQTSLFMLGKGAEMVGKGIGMFTDILSAALMWQILRGLGKSPWRLLGKAGLAAGAIATAGTAILWTISEADRFMDNLRFVAQGGNYEWITPNLETELERRSWGYRYLLGRSSNISKFFSGAMSSTMLGLGGLLEKGIQFFAMIDINRQTAKIREQSQQLNEAVQGKVKAMFADINFYHAKDLWDIQQAISANEAVSKKFIERTRGFLQHVLKIKGAKEWTDAYLSQWLAAIYLKPDFLKQVATAANVKVKEGTLENFANEVKKFVDKVLAQIKETKDALSKLDKLAGGKPIDVTQFDRYLKFLGIFKIPPGPSIWGDLPVPMQAPIKVVYDHSATNLLTAAKELKDASRQQWRNAIGFNPNVYAAPVVIYEY